MSSAYSLQRLRNGQYAVFAAAYGETMHPGAGPQAEAEWVHVGQLKLRERQRAQAGYSIHRGYRRIALSELLEVDVDTISAALSKKPTAGSGVGDGSKVRTTKEPFTRRAPA